MFPKASDFAQVVGVEKPVAEVPARAVVRYQGAVWYLDPEVSASSGTYELVGEDDDLHRQAGGIRGGLNVGNRLKVSGDVRVEQITESVLSDSERVQRMPYGSERGSELIALQHAQALKEIGELFPDIDGEEIARRYRAGEVRFDNREVALAVAKYASIATFYTEPARVGQGMGNTSAVYVAVIHCENSGEWLVVLNPETGKQTCPLCGENYESYRGARAAASYHLTNGHRYQKGASLPFDDQKS